jgi:stage II sporulation protein D
MPLPARMQTVSLASPGRIFAGTLLVAVAGYILSPAGAAQSTVSEDDLERLSGSRVISVGTPSNGRIAMVPLETYVARVIAGEAEPSAPETAQQAVAIAIRTYALFNLRRHTRDGYDLCDTTHCQVPRASTAATRRATQATAGQVLLYNGAPASLFYSANCGGQSEAAVDVWPGINYPYLRSVADDVHENDTPWTLELTLEQIRTSLRGAGFTGDRLDSMEVEGRTLSGRVGRLHLQGLRPETIAGDAFRMALGPAVVRSTAFTFEQSDGRVRFIGRGYGHGVGMCVVGAARRARRGDSAEEILSLYYPGLRLANLAVLSAAPDAAGAAPR